MAEDKSKRNLAILLLFAIGLILRLFLLASTSYTADDSLITYRYAENIASGLGFAYNPGERVLGTTTPLYTLLLSLLIKTGAQINVLGKGMNILADCLAGALIFLILRCFRFGFAFLASLFYLCFPRILVWSISGMETGIYLFLIGLSFYFYMRRDFNLLPLVLALAWLTRADAFLLIAALFLDYLIRRKKLPLRMIALTFAFILPWCIFATFHFGSPIPNSIWAKKALYQDVLQTPKATILWEFLILKTKIGWLILGSALLGIYATLRKNKDLSFIIIWTLLYACFYLFAGTRMHSWYYVPFYLGYLMLAARGSVFVYESLNSFAARLWERKKQISLFRGIRFAFLLLVVFVCLFVYRSQMKRTIELVRSEQTVLDRIHKRIGLWLKENSDVGDTVCAEDIGYMGYFSRRYILDQDGLVSPQAVPFNKEKDRLGLIQKYLPRFVVVGFYGPYYKEVIHSAWFKKNYRILVRFSILGIRPGEFSEDSTKVDLGGTPEFAIYQRFDDLG